MKDDWKMVRFLQCFSGGKCRFNVLKSPKRKVKITCRVNVYADNKVVWKIKITSRLFSSHLSLKYSTRQYRKVMRFPESNAIPRK